MSVSPRRLLVGAGAAIAVVATLAGCTQKSDAKSEDGAVQVVAKDDSCEVSKKDFPAGHVKLNVENRGSKVTEVYVLYPDDRIVAERENIGPGI
ncbi:cupredoxin domain-containing protein, partial [Streptomyces sp. NPDC004288]